MNSWLAEYRKRTSGINFPSSIPFHPSTPNSMALKNESKPDAVLTQLSGEGGRGGGVDCYFILTFRNLSRGTIFFNSGTGSGDVGVRDSVKSGPAAKLNYTDLQSIFPPPTQPLSLIYVFGSTAFFITRLPLVVLSMGHDLVMYHSTQIHKGIKKNPCQKSG